MRRIVVLGASGSIGTQALDVVRAHPGHFEVVGLAAGRDHEVLTGQAKEFGVTELALHDSAAAARLRHELPAANVRDGAEGVAELAALGDADLVLNGITGSQGLGPTLSALEAGHPVALANKESLIVGGELVVAAADDAGGRGDRLIPVDSEHSALAQALRGGRAHEVHRLVLTASGGPFRGADRTTLEQVTAAQALAHPTWDMGPVITINSATLMNKGLELIEAHLLFGIPYARLDVVVHPQSIVHSMVEFVDGSTLAQLSPPDMRLPIQLALAWPERLEHAFVRMDWTTAATLEFEPVDRDTFRALDLAIEAGTAGGTYPAALNAANEQAVHAFLRDALPFTAITEVVAEVLDAHEAQQIDSIETVEAADRDARHVADRLIRSRG